MQTGTWALGGTLLQAVISLSASQLLTLAENPISLIAAPGPGRAAVLVAATVSLEAGSVPFANPGSATCSIVYNGPSSAPAASSTLTSLLGNSASELQVLDGIASTLARVEVDGQAVLLTNSGADWTAGNGNLVISVLYFLATL